MGVPTERSRDGPKLMPLLPILLPLASAAAVLPGSVSASAAITSDFVLAAGTVRPAARSDSGGATLRPDLPPEQLHFDPVLTLRPRARGPLFEVGALGGGQEWAPSLVHVAVDWQF